MVVAFLLVVTSHGFVSVSFRAHVCRHVVPAEAHVIVVWRFVFLSEVYLFLSGWIADQWWTNCGRRVDGKD